MRTYNVAVFGARPLLRFVHTPDLDRQIQALTRPDKSLLTYYVLKALAFPPLFPILILPLYFKYQTMRYSFRDDGVSMSWGILFRREVIVNYARIQDVHLRSNVVERWLGLGRILVQTASGSSTAEMTIEGILEYEALRDYLYSKTRGVREMSSGHQGAPAVAEVGTSVGQDELAASLRDVAQELRLIRSALEKQKPADGRDQP